MGLERVNSCNSRIPFGIIACRIAVLADGTTETMIASAGSYHKQLKILAFCTVATSHLALLVRHPVSELAKDYVSASY